MKGTMTTPVAKYLHVADNFDETDETQMMELTVRIQELIAKHKDLDGYAYMETITKSGERYAVLLPAEYEKAEEVSGRLQARPTMSLLSRPAKLVEKYEGDNPGYKVVQIDTYNQLVYLQRLDKPTVENRQLFSTALGLKPWEVVLSRIPGNGWKIKLPDSFTYVPSKYDTKLQEAVDQVSGTKGWFFEANSKMHVILVHPAKLPTFPAIIPIPKKYLDNPDIRYTAFGMKLPSRGRKTGDPMIIDWKNSAANLLVGESNSGKSVVSNDLIYGCLNGGCKLAIVDHYAKASDYLWCRPWVMDKGWGCDSLESSAAVMQNILRMVDKGGERAEAWRKNGWQNWWDIPPSAKKDYPMILLVIDEITQLTITDNTRMDKDDPQKPKVMYENSLKNTIRLDMTKLLAIARAFGVRFIIATQAATQQTGLGPIVRINLPGKIGVGERLSSDIVGMFKTDKKDLPSVPDNVIADGVGKGCGVAELVGQLPAVYKGYYNQDAEHSSNELFLASKLAEHIGPGHGDEAGKLTWSQITDLVPATLNKPDDGMGDEDDRQPSRLETEGGFGIDGRDVAEHDKPLQGAAAAAHGSAVEAAMAIARASNSQGL